MKRTGSADHETRFPSGNFGLSTSLGPFVWPLVDIQDGEMKEAAH
jgi:hypothetical protein